MKARIVFATFALCALAGCVLPQWRIFQRHVDAKIAEKSPKQIEAEREAAQFIEVKSAVAEPDIKAQIAAIHSVATSLSSSLGEPQRVITPSVDDQAKVIEGLRKGLLDEQKKTEQWRAFAKKYAGTPLEGTGINLAGPAGLLGLAGVVALCIAFPSVGYIVLRVLPVLWGYFRRTTDAIGEFAKANPEAGQKLATTLSQKMDAAHKRLVRVRATIKQISVMQKPATSP
jgi:hypothetical protein